MSCRVALINPISKDEAPFIRIGRCQTHVQPGIGTWPPIDLALIGGELKKLKGISDVWLYDAQLEADYYLMVRKILIYQPDIVILNCTTPTVKGDIELASLIKRKSGKVAIIFYGMHVTVRADEVLVSGVVDCCVRKEPEDTIKAICEEYVKSGHLYAEGIRNASFYIGGEIRRAPAGISRSETFLNSYPDRSLIDNKCYRLPYHNRPFTIIQTSRGCNNRCIYCTSPLYTAHHYSRSVEAVIEEICSIYYQYGIRDIMFLSDTFTADKEWILDLCRRIIALKLNLHWMANSRVDTIDQETAGLMKKAGCWLISLGIESGDEEILAAARKNIKPEQVRTAVDILKTNGIQSIGYFMFGLPGETVQTIKKTIRFAGSLPLNYAYFFLATPFPGTELYQKALKNNWLLTQDWEVYSHGRNCLLKYEQLPAKALQGSVKKAYLAFYLRPAWIIKHIRNVKNFRVLINYMKAGISLIKEN